jgi:transposase
VFLKRTRSVQGDREYGAVLLVQGERVPAARTPGRPRKDARVATKVVHRTLANLSKLPPGLIDLVERYCAAERAGETLELSAASAPMIGPAYGPLAALLALARECGIEKALGKTRMGRLALFLVLARVLHRGSRRSAARWAGTQATAPILGLERFDEEDLYRALDWLEAEHLRVERALAPKRPSGATFLYDVTSSYLEGQQNELAAPGYNRDGKRFKKQVVVGLLTDAGGEPVSVHVYEGNRADPTTVPDRVQWLAKDLGAEHVVLVGDRGMLKGPARELLGRHGFRYVTALTDPELRRRLNEGTLQLDLFTEEVAEVVGEDGVRYVLRRTPATTERHRARRADQLARVRAKVDARNAFMDAHPRADVAVSLRQAQRWIQAYKLGGFVSARSAGRHVVIDIDEAKREREEELDGCYAVITDVPRTDATAQQVWARYGDLQRVERDFRTLKTGLLELRPIFLRKAGRTRAHALVAMLALKLVRALERKIAPLKISAAEALDRLDAVRLVSLGAPGHGLWRLPTRWDAPQRELLDVLPTVPAPVLSLGGPTA